MENFKVTKHALERLFERKISVSECLEVYFQEKVIESYPDDTPFPSELRMGKINKKVIHIVCSHGEKEVFLITAYEPNPIVWNSDFTKRQK